MVFANTGLRCGTQVQFFYGPADIAALNNGFPPPFPFCLPSRQRFSVAVTEALARRYRLRLPMRWLEASLVMLCAGLFTRPDGCGLALEQRRPIVRNGSIARLTVKP